MAKGTYILRYFSPTSRAQWVISIWQLTLHPWDKTRSWEISFHYTKYFKLCHNKSDCSNWSDQLCFRLPCFGNSCFCKTLLHSLTVISPPIQFDESICTMPGEMGLASAGKRWMSLQITAFLYQCIHPQINGSATEPLWRAVTSSSPFISSRLLDCDWLKLLKARVTMVDARWHWSFMVCVQVEEELNYWRKLSHRQKSSSNILTRYPHTPQFMCKVN